MPIVSASFSAIFPPHTGNPRRVVFLGPFARETIFWGSCGRLYLEDRIYYSEESCRESNFCTPLSGQGPFPIEPGRPGGPKLGRPRIYYRCPFFRPPFSATFGWGRTSPLLVFRGKNPKSLIFGPFARESNFSTPF